MIKDEKKLIEITEAELSYQKLYEFVEASSCGAVNIFIGTVRDHAEGQDVEALEYHGYQEMAEKELAAICDNALQKWAIFRIAVQHRLGLLNLKEASVMIIVSSSHRDVAFAACRFIIEEIKEKLPIWKKEHFVDGNSQWKNASFIQ